jgi:hypothetical protein
MQQDLIGYDEIIENSMRSVIYETLKKVEKNGLPGKHYFIVTFLTPFPEVSLSKALKEKYPEEMTIAIQYQFKNLVVENNSFKVSLSFSGKYERLVIPYKAITSFADPSINFALKFSMTYGDIEEIENGNFGDEKQASNINGKGKKNKNSGVDLSAKVISLDAFRKNKVESDNTNNDD